MNPEIGFFVERQNYLFPGFFVFIGHLLLFCFLL